jgi:hypothetical protein
LTFAPSNHFLFFTIFSVVIKKININKMALNAHLPNFYVQWPRDAVRTLIERRRANQQLFCTTTIRGQKRIWRAIAVDINNAHPNFAPTRTQCRTKWNALKTGYENLKRLLSGNPQRFPTHTPSLHDEEFHEGLTDEFWLVECKYLLFN